MERGKVPAAGCLSQDTVVMFDKLELWYVDCTGRCACHVFLEGSTAEGQQQNEKQYLVISRCVVTGRIRLAFAGGEVTGLRTAFCG